MSWNLPPPPGFQGLQQDLSLTKYQRHLPHWRQDAATYFTTFRLHDSLPQSKLNELMGFRAEWERRRLPPRTSETDDELTREIMRRVERWLDQGLGSCVLKCPDVSALVVNSLMRDDGGLYELGCYVVMPNHVHAVVRPLVPATAPLEKIQQRWKGSSSLEVNRHLRQSGTLWQQECFDRIIRDEEHLYRVIQYIGRNPKNAGFTPESVRLWIRPTWVELGWNFEIT